MSKPAPAPRKSSGKSQLKSIPETILASIDTLGDRIRIINVLIKDHEEDRNELKAELEQICRDYHIDKHAGSTFRLNHIVSVTQTLDESLLLLNGVGMDVIEASKRPVVKDYYRIDGLSEPKLKEKKS